MSATPPPLGLRLALLWIALWEPLAPASHRTTWRDQWRADLWHYAAWLAREGRTGLTLRLFARAGTAPIHAFLLRVQSWSLHMLMHDVRFAWRMLARRPTFTAVAIAILGLGIGANATIFSWVETTLISPLPGVPEQRRLVSLRGKTPSIPDMSFSYLNFIDTRAAKPAGLEDITAFRALPMSLRADGEPVRVWGQLVTANFFDVLRVGPVLGRTFVPGDGAVLEKEPVAVISHAFWRRQFNTDPGVIGRAVTLSGQPFTIVGVASEGFRGSVAGVSLDVFVPLTMQRLVLGGNRLPERANSFLQVFGRLSPGASIAEVEASTAVVAARLEAAYPTTNKGRGIRVLPLWRDGASSILLPIMALLMGVVGIVLLIACANLAGLLLARAAGRQREIAVRLAVGASRGRLVRQFLIETALLAIGGGAAGLVLSTWTASLLNGFLPPVAVPLGFTATMSPAVLAFSLVTTFATAALVGLFPAIKASRPDVSAALRDAGGGATMRRGWMRPTLVVAQLSLSLVLLAGAALFGRSLQRATVVDPGFSLRRGFVASLELGVNAYDAERGTVLYRELVRRVSSIAGVEAATVTTAIPLDLSTSSNMSIEIDGYQRAQGEEVAAYYARIGPAFFDTMGIPIVKGRAIDDRDVAGGALAVVINETMAAKYFQGRDPIGASLRYGRGPARVVGVARDGKYRRLNEDAQNFMYVPVAQFYRPEAGLIVRTAGDPLALVNAVRAEVRQLDPNLPLFDVRTVDEYRQFSRFLPRMASILLSVFGGLALLLAAVGLYSVIAFSVAQRTREIGLRMALGADRGRVVRMILKQGLGLAAAGIAIGSILAAAVAQAIGSQLIGVHAFDPVSWALTIGVLAAVAVMACAFPALHAASLDPLRALRHD